MGIPMRDTANTLRVVKGFKMRDASNVLRTAQTIRMRDASNVLRTVWTALSASASPLTVTGTLGPFGPSALVVNSNNTKVPPAARKSVVLGKRVSVRVELGGRRL